MNDESELIYDEVVDALLEILKQKEKELAGHNQRVALAGLQSLWVIWAWHIPRFHRFSTHHPVYHLQIRLSGIRGEAAFSKKVGLYSPLLLNRCLFSREVSSSWVQRTMIGR
jgi:hypothetical protein